MISVLTSNKMKFDKTQSRSSVKIPSTDKYWFLRGRAFLWRKFEFAFTSYNDRNIEKLLQIRILDFQLFMLLWRIYHSSPKNSSGIEKGLRNFQNIFTY